MQLHSEVQESPDPPNPYVDSQWTEYPLTFLNFLLSHVYRIAQDNSCAFKGSIFGDNPYKARLQVCCYETLEEVSCVVTIDPQKDPNDQLVSAIIELIGTIDWDYPIVHRCCGNPWPHFPLCMTY